MDINPNTNGTASARFLLMMIMGILLMIVMLSILADMVTGAGMVDKLLSAIGGFLSPTV